MIGIGPFPTSAVLLALVIVTAALVAWRTQRRWQLSGSGSHLLDAAGVGLLVARLAFVLRWWPQYRDDPLLIVRIGDGGFMLVPGLLAAVLWLWWRTRATPLQRRPIAVGALAGSALWAFLAGSVMLMHASVALPEVPLATLQGEQATLTQFRGQPLVVNLWATWCPPCRREMPVLAAAQQENPAVGFAFVNQGESPGTIVDFIRTEGLELDNVMLDPLSSLMREVGSRGLPTTLFFDRHGQLVDSHMGEVTPATMKQKLQRMQ